MRTNAVNTTTTRKLEIHMFHFSQWIVLVVIAAFLNAVVVPLHGFSPRYSTQRTILNKTPTHDHHRCRSLLSSPLKRTKRSSSFLSPPSALFMSSNARRDDEDIDLTTTTTTTTPIQQERNRRQDSSSSPPSSDDDIQATTPPRPNDDDDATMSSSFWKSISNLMQSSTSRQQRLPPIRIEDTNVLLYDVFLLINLVVSISFWAVHRMSFDYIGIAFNEGSLLSLCWILAGLYTGAFLNSAVDAHYGSSDNVRGGPQGAGLLGLHTFIMTINLRLLFAFFIAILQHRAVGIVGGELLIPLEIGFGLLLMTAWRAIHSYIMPRF